MYSFLVEIEWAVFFIMYMEAEFGALFDTSSITFLSSDNVFLAFCLVQRISVISHFYPSDIFARSRLV